VLRARAEGVNSAQAVRQPYLDLDANLVTKLLRELQVPPLTTQMLYIHTLLLPEVPRGYHAPVLMIFLSRRGTPMSTGSDLAPGGPIPKTSSRSRCASISAGSTRARSTTIVVHSGDIVCTSYIGNIPFHILESCRWTIWQYRSACRHWKTRGRHYMALSDCKLLGCSVGLAESDVVFKSRTLDYMTPNCDGEKKTQTTHMTTYMGLSFFCSSCDVHDQSWRSARWQC
jgi:hypothetical protein